MGVKISLNHKVEDVLAELSEDEFDAMFIAIGAPIGKRIDIPVRDVAHVYTAVRLFHDAEIGDAPNWPPRRRLRRRKHGYGCGADGKTPRGGSSLDHFLQGPPAYGGARVRGK